MRILAPSLAAAALLVAAVPAYAQSTTRIETRPYYGAIVTMEQGVRVFRPLPPTGHMIINPGGATPLGLSIADVKVEEHRTNHNYHYHEDSEPTYRGGGIGGFYAPGYYGKRHHPGHGHRPLGGGLSIQR